MPGTPASPVIQRQRVLPPPANSPHALPPVAQPIPSTSGAKKTPTIAIFNADGSIKLAPQKKDPHTQDMERSAELMNRGHNMLKCKQTRFAESFAPYESLGEGFAKKLRYIGLYNSETAKAVKRRAEQAAQDCDGQ